jgi:hypothetical protein
MIKLIIATILVVTSQMTLAVSENVKIVNVDAPTNSSEDYLLFADNGLVYEVESSRVELVNLAIQAANNEIEVEISFSDDEHTRDILNTRSVIENIKFLTQPVSNTKGIKILDEVNEEVVVAPILNSYITDFKTEESVQKIFAKLNKKTKRRSQCYNRAHVWSWDLYHYFHNDRRIQTGKVWIYFTKKYIRAYGHKWWFHIAPYLTVNGEERVIDRVFSKSPESIQNWTNRFIKTNEVCPEVKLYSEYKSRIYTDNCIIMKSSVFYWQPQHLKKAELNGTEKTEWVKAQLNRAYSDVFGWRAKAPNL